MKPRCFVAMPIGRHDTDTLYDNHIRPAIEAAGLTPCRVDRIVHNDRIDERIRREIARANVVVADLTYARPSVYWEAGFAERSSPVIYIVRADHFSQSDDDLLGNQTVHFDLRNANIIGWKGSGDIYFERELTKRLRFVMAPLIASREKELERKKERKEFSELALTERRRVVNIAVSSSLAPFGFDLLLRGDIHPNSEDVRFLSRLHRTIMWKKDKNVAYLVYAFPTFSTLRKKSLEYLNSNMFGRFSRASEYAIWEELPVEITSLTRRKIRKIRRLLIVPVISTVPRSRIEGVLSSWRGGFPTGWYFMPSLHEPFRVKSGHSKAISSSNEILILDKISSLSDFRDALSSTIENIESRDDVLIDYPVR
jgi:hypothetical protein